MREREATTGELDAAFGVGRARLVQLCARLAGASDVAEDLAQETLLEAWRLRGKLHNMDGVESWLAAIARHVCRRHARNWGRSSARFAQRSTFEDVVGDFLDEIPSHDEDAAIVLERSEMVALLDRALALLPIETRQALLAHYIEELPQAVVASRLGISEGVLRVRLHRGKLALRRALATDLREDALALGIAQASSGDEPVWTETRIWCPFCGSHQLAYSMDRQTGAYIFRCPGACVPGSIVGAGRDPVLLAELVSPKAILTRLCLELSTEYRRHLAPGGQACPYCGRKLDIQQWDTNPPTNMRGAVDALTAAPLLHGVTLLCSSCRGENGASAWHLALDTPEAVQFWRQHPRMRALPIREVAFDGRPALVTGFESRDRRSRLELVSARDTYEVLWLERASGR